MPFQPFDLGQIMSTAENIKSSRLQQQYLGERGKRETAQFDQATQAENTQLLAQAAESIVNAPPGQAVQQAYNIAKKLKAKGILEFDEAALGNWTDENVRGFAKQKLDEVAPFVPQQDPGKLHSVVGPDGKIILMPGPQAVGMEAGPTGGISPIDKLLIADQLAGARQEGNQQFTAEQNRLGREATAANQATAQTARAAVPQQKIEATRANEARSNQRTLAVWDTAKTELISALGATKTGPIAGRLPAVTPNQQIAEGSIAAVAPVLKQLFRSAGEGIFTDRDQDLLLQMVPKRTDHPETIKAKLANIDSIVQAKLAVPGGAAPAEAAAPAVDQTADQPITDGTIIVNPSTGERMKLQGGQWVPA